MKSLAQIRAANALEASNYPKMGIGQDGGDALSGFPMLIQTNGLLAACAFAIELNKKEELKHLGEFVIVFAVMQHLAHGHIGIYNPSASDATADQPARIAEEWLGKQPAVKAFISHLADSPDASLLRRATSEALAFLGYLKRFVA